MSQDTVETGSAWLEVRLEEELGEPGRRIAADVLADLVDGSPERPACRSLRSLVDLECATAHDVQRGRIALGRDRGFPEFGDHRRNAIERHVAAIEAVAERDGASDHDRAVSTDGDRWVRLLNGLGLDLRARHLIELPSELDDVIRPDRLQATQE